MKKVNYLTLVVLFLFGLIFLGNTFQKGRLTNGRKNGMVEVVSCNAKPNYYLLRGTLFKEDILIYTDQFYLAGTTLVFDGVLEEPQKKSYDEDFDYAKYLKNQGINYICYFPKLRKKGFNFKHNTIKSYLLNEISHIVPIESYQYISALVFGVNTFTIDVKDSIKSIGISHLFAVSGLHVNMLYGILMGICFLLNKNEQNNQVIALSILSAYVIFFCFMASAIRAILFLFFNKLKLPKAQTFLLTFVVMCFLKPTYLLGLDFILSFLVAFVLITVSTSGKNKMLGAVKLTFLSCLISLPFIINTNNSFNFLVLILSPFFVFLFSVLVLPTAFLSAIFVFATPLFNYVFISMNYLITSLGNINGLTMHVKSMNAFEIIIYYLFLYFFLQNINKKKYFFVLISYLILVNLLAFTNPYPKITFIDVGQGDSALIELPFNKGNILIDSFGDNLTYLHKKGIRRIDYLFLTHGDNDHIGSAFDLIKEFQVKKIIVSKYDDSEEIKQIRAMNNSIVAKSGETFKIGDCVIKVIGPIKEYSDLNDNSLVLMIDYQKSFLFTGDMGVIPEEDLIYKYGQSLKAFCLKIGHHGSETSSSSEFLNMVDCEYAIFSVGIKNKYGHPSPLIINRLNDKEVFLTKDNGNITFIYRNNCWQVLPYRS